MDLAFRYMKFRQYMMKVHTVNREISTQDKETRTISMAYVHEHVFVVCIYLSNNRKNIPFDKYPFLS